MADHYGKLENTTVGTLATKAFFEAAETWLSDGYYLDQRLIARESGGHSAMSTTCQSKNLVVWTINCD